MPAPLWRVVLTQECSATAGVAASSQRDTSVDLSNQVLDLETTRRVQIGRRKAPAGRCSGVEPDETGIEISGEPLPVDFFCGSARFVAFRPCDPFSDHPLDL